MDDRKIDDRKKPNKKLNKPILTIFSILGFVLLAAGIFLGAYYFLIDKTSNSYEANVKDLIKKIDAANISVTLLSKEDQSAIDPEKSRKGLPEKIQTLTDIKTKLQALVPTDKYKSEHEALISGLNNNILIYRQIDAFLGNVNGKDIEASGENLKKYKEDCVNNYLSASASNILEITLPKESETFINNTINYINTLSATLKENEITQSQNFEFITSIDDILSSFNAIKVDLSSQVLSSRNSGGSFDSIITQANRFRDDLNFLDQRLSNLSIPSDALNAYNLLKNTFEDYDSYLQGIIFAINNEKLLGEKATPEKLEELYGSSNLKFSKVKTNYNNFLKYYTNFKDSSIK